MILITMKRAAGVILVLALVAGVLSIASCSGGSEGLRIGSTAPDFKLNNLDGNSISLNSYKGYSVLLNFWNSSANSGVRDRPFFQELYNSWSGRNDIVLLTIDIGEDQATVKGFMENNKYTFPVLLDTQYEVAARYGVQYMPTSILIGKDGKIKLNTIGEFKTKEAIERQLASLL
jgi:peroxiredoxin